MGSFLLFYQATYLKFKKMFLFTSIIFQIKTVDKLKTAGQNTGKTIPMTTETAIWRLHSSLSFIKLASVFFGL